MCVGKTPGGDFGFEKAPFKLTAEMMELMGGAQSAHFYAFRDVCVKTFMQLRRHHHRIVLSLEMLAQGNEHLACFCDGKTKVLEQFRQRFKPDLNDQAALEFVHHLIDESIDNWTTTCYDKYQRCFVGIL
jgi:phosphatidylinositol kinase/protein kinase (PI-3  family)